MVLNSTAALLKQICTARELQSTSKLKEELTAAVKQIWSSGSSLHPVC